MPYQSKLPPARDGFGRLVLAEWTKFRSVPRWAVAMVAAMVLTVLLAMFSSSSSGFGTTDQPVVGPDGRVVNDNFQFAHQPLDGDGSVTARVVTQSVNNKPTPGWAKAGVMIKASTKAGSPYAAMMVTPGHGVRMQWNFTNDRAGGEGPAPRWLRLTRAGEVITGYESVDGRNWRQVAAATLEGLPRQVEVGLFAATPPAVRHDRGFGSSSTGAASTSTTATFSDASLRPGAWRADSIGISPDPAVEGIGETREAGGVFTVTGGGDIAPMEMDGDDRVGLPLTGVTVGLLVVAALGVLFITAEYRRGMIRTTFVASPRRGRVLAAKAVVLAAVTFATGLVACVVAVLASQPALRSGGFEPPWYPDPSLTDPKVLGAIVGSAALLALVAVFSLGLGAVLRQSAGAIAIVVVMIVVPTIIVSALPIDAGVWLNRLTLVAGFSVQDTQPRYHHMDTPCLPESGCSYDQPWAGLLVVGAYVVAILLAGVWLLRRRDA